MKESKCLSCGQGLGEVERLEKCVKELEAHRVPNPGVVGTLQDKNTLLEYKDAQIARLQARVEELEAHTKVAESDFVLTLLRIHGLLGMADADAREIDDVVQELVDERDEALKRVAELERERDEARNRVAELRGMDTPWPLCDVIRTLRYATSHLLQYHDCDCDGWESYAGALEESDRYEKMLRNGGPPTAEGGVMTAEARVAALERERCEHCGATLNVSGCPRCGAPVCCPQCCQIQSLTERAGKLQAAVKEPGEAPEEEQG